MRIHLKWKLIYGGGFFFFLRMFSSGNGESTNALHHKSTDN